jgi:hypothetical protein
MPRAFTQCQHNPRSHIVTIHPSKTHKCDYLRVCYVNGKAHRGELHHKHGCHKHDGDTAVQPTSITHVKPAKTSVRSDVKSTADLAADRVAPSIIVTVPHAACPKFKWYVAANGRLVIRHLCDTFAVEAAHTLVAKLEELLPTSYIVMLPSPDPRSKVDSNRNQSRSTKYRKHVDRMFRQQLKRNPNNVWSIDVHSFPPNKDSFTDSKGGKDPLVTLLDNYDGKAISSLTLELQSFLNKHNVTTNVFKGTEANDISRRALEMGVKRSYLLEFNEALQPTQEWEAYVTMLANGEHENVTTSAKKRVTDKQAVIEAVAVGLVG